VKLYIYNVRNGMLFILNVVCRTGRSSRASPLFWSCQDSYM